MKKNPNPNPSKNTSTPTPPPPSSRQHDVVPTQTEITNPTTEEEGRAAPVAGEIILKTPMQVLEELTGGDDNVGGDSGSGSVPLGGGGGRAPMACAVAVGVGGGGIVMNVIDHHKRKGGGGVEVAVKEKESTKKPRQSEVKDPPTGTPTCQICGRQFQTWKGAFGHMRSHPDRQYRGFFRPPVFGSSTSASAPAPNTDTTNKGVGSSNTAAVDEPPVAVAVEENVEEEGRNLLGLDLNKMPEDDNDE